MKRHLSVFNVLFDDRYGGPSKRILLVSKILEEHGVSTTLVLPQGNGNVERIATDSGVGVERQSFSRIPRLRSWRQVMRWFLRLPLDVLRLRRLLKAREPDVVHVNGAFFLAPAIACKTTKSSLVWHLNDVIVPPFLARPLGGIVRLLADRVVVSSAAVGVHYRVPATLATVLYPPVDTKDIRPRENTDIWPAIYGPVRIGLIANWNPIKGVDHFVQAVAKVHETLGRGLEVVLTGAHLSNHPQYRRRVESLIDELGMRSVLVDHGFQPDVAGVLRDLDIVVMASTSEAVSMVVLEGMAAGLPVVATDVGGVRELLTPESDQRAGIVVPPAEPQAMAEAILSLLQNPDKALAMGRAGRRYVETKFSVEKAAESHFELYCQALSARDATVP